MCGRFTLNKTAAEVARHFGLAAAPTLSPRFNIAPSQPVAVVRAGGRAARECALLRWGLVPSWSRDPKMGARLINARSETAADKPAFRAAMRRRRCLVPADGFYEWQATDGAKQPYFVHLQGHALFAIAGLWEHWQDSDGSELETCTLLTTAPNALMAPIHNRMPVIVAPEHYELWLDPQVQRTEPLQPVLEPFRPEAMAAYPVSTRVNSPRNDDEECIAPLTEPPV